MDVIGWLLEGDPAMAVEVVQSKRQPGRWNTLRALRVLDWWDRGSRTAT